MKKAVILFATLAMSLSANAAVKDVKIMNTLIDSGAETEQFMSQIHVSVENAVCRYGHASKVYECNMTDVTTKKTLSVNGKKAQKLFALLMEAGASKDSAMGKTYVGSKFISCKQLITGVEDSPAAPRTDCSVNTSAAE